MSMTVEQEQKLNELHTAIVGNEKIRQKGIIERVEILEKHKEKNQLSQAKQTGFFTAIGIAITEFGRFLFSHH